MTSASESDAPGVSAVTSSGRAQDLPNPSPLPEHEEFTESVVDSIDRMRNDGGLAPELPHRRPRTGEAEGPDLRDSLNVDG
ncbi:MAG: hypothetical protein K6T30_03295 [Alicyclobacillus sp.]|nr:hypothetical protein [Alicyclobacillus sp.]